VDLSSATKVVEARRCIARHLKVHESEVRLLRGDLDLGDEASVGQDNLELQGCRDRASTLISP